MAAAEYLKENSDWFDKSPGGEKLYFESEVIKMMEKYSSQTETLYTEEEIIKAFHIGRCYQGREGDTTIEQYLQSLKQNK